MAVSKQGKLLTTQYSRNQNAIFAGTVQNIVSIWSQLDSADFVNSWPGIKELVKFFIGQRRQQSITISVDYYDNFRRAENADGIYNAKPTGLLPVEQVNKSLDYAGKGSFFNSLGKGKTEKQANKDALAAVLASSTRLVADGGRSTINENVDKDEVALGYARITGPNPCYFCAMQASRGFVYKSAKTAGDPREGGRQYHDDCHCKAIPFFSLDDEMSAQMEKYSVLWDELTDGYSGQDAIKAFRRGFDKR